MRTVRKNTWQAGSELSSAWCYLERIDEVEGGRAGEVLEEGLVDAGSTPEIDVTTIVHEVCALAFQLRRRETESSRQDDRARLVLLAPLLWIGINVVVSRASLVAAAPG